MTLIELLISLGVTAMLVGVLGSVIFQFTMAAEQGNERLDVLHDVQNAGYWITADAKRALTTDLVEGAQPVESMTLGWSEGSQSHTVVYSLSERDLERAHNGVTRVVARHVSEAGFALSQGVVTVTLTSSPEGRWEVSKETVYKSYLRTRD